MLMNIDKLSVDILHYFGLVLHVWMMMMIKVK